MHIHFKKVLSVFVLGFLLAFALLNSRFIIVSARYYLDKAEFTEAHPSARLLPIADSVTRRPLPNEATLVIDDINVAAPVIFEVGNDLDKIYKALESGVVHYSDTPKPGLGGVSVILGHSSAYPWYRGNYGAVFALLSKLKPGNKIIVQYSDGRTFTYVVKQSLVFSPFEDDGKLKELEEKSGSSLILVSCWPVGTNYRRIAVQAELI